jgi:hypothetical protein
VDDVVQMLTFANAVCNDFVRAPEGFLVKRRTFTRGVKRFFI